MLIGVPIMMIKNLLVAIVCFLGSNLITWSAKKQATVSCLSTEVEYRCLTTAATELTWVQSLLQEIRVFIWHPPMLWCDNLSSIALANNSVFHAWKKHIELDVCCSMWFILRERHMEKKGQMSKWIEAERHIVKVCCSMWLIFRGIFGISLLEG